MHENYNKYAYFAVFKFEWLSVTIQSGSARHDGRGQHSLRNVNAVEVFAELSSDHVDVFQRDGLQRLRGDLQTLGGVHEGVSAGVSLHELSEHCGLKR